MGRAATPSWYFAIALLFVWIATMVSAAFVIAFEVFFLVFLGLLFAVFLVKVARTIEGSFSFSYPVSVAITLVLLLVMTAALMVFFGNRVIQRLDEFESSFNKYSNVVKEKVAKHEQIQRLAVELPLVGSFFNASGPQSENPSDADDSESSADPTSTASGPSAQTLRRGASLLTEIFATTLGVLTNLAVIFFVGVFIAIDPALYKGGVVRLFPVDQRLRVSEVMDNLGATLWQWLIGRAISILIIGFGTAVSLWLLEVPLPVTLGVVTGLMTFVPNVGGLFAFVFAVIFALSVGVSTAIWVAAIYLGLQFVESNVITPLVQQKQVAVPPALMIASQFLMGVLFGILGILVATPLLAVSLVCVKKFYVEGSLEQHESVDDAASENTKDK